VLIYWNILYAVYDVFCESVAYSWSMTMSWMRVLAACGLCLGILSAIFSVTWYGGFHPLTISQIHVQ